LILLSIKGGLAGSFPKALSAKGGALSQKKKSGQPARNNLAALLIRYVQYKTAYAIDYVPAFKAELLFLEALEHVTTILSRQSSQPEFRQLLLNAPR
jgi:hypothetical protein